MMGLIGVSVGVLASLLKACIAVLSAARYRGITWLLSGGGGGGGNGGGSEGGGGRSSRSHSSFGAWAGLVLAWLYGSGFTALASALAAAPVVLFAPAAAGAGVAEVMACLNGVVVPSAFSLPTLAAKLVSAALAVGGGLPVGAEGPMVHVGALVGGGLSQGSSTTLRATSPWFARFRNPKDKRDFVAAGTAVGIAAAFGAPIGGLLFAFEELSVPFSAALAAQIFFACVAAVLTVDTLRSAGAAAVKGGGEGRALFGLFDGAASTVLFEVRTQLANHVASMVPAAAIGVACGLLAVAFTRAILRVALFRRDGGSGGGGGEGSAPSSGSGRSGGGEESRRRSSRKPAVRLAEVALAGALFASFAILLPLLFGCTRADCVLPALSGGGGGGDGSGSAAPSPSPPSSSSSSPPSSWSPSATGSLFPAPSICPVPAWASGARGKGRDAKWRVVDADVEPFLCGDRRRLSPTAGSGGGGGGDGPTKNGTMLPSPPSPSSSKNSSSSASAPSYNQLATLSLLSGEGVIRRLLSRGTHRELGYLALAATAALHLCGAAWAATAPLASGLFVPMLVIGAAVGRFVGLALVDVVALFGGGEAFSFFLSFRFWRAAGEEKNERKSKKTHPLSYLSLSLFHLSYSSNNNQKQKNNRLPRRSPRGLPPPEPLGLGRPRSLRAPRGRSVHGRRHPPDRRRRRHHDGGLQRRAAAAAAAGGGARGQDGRRRRVRRAALPRDAFRQVRALFGARAAEERGAAGPGARQGVSVNRRRFQDKSWPCAQASHPHPVSSPG